MTQLALDLVQPLIVGQQAVPLLTELNIRCMRRNLMTRNFLIAQSENGRLCTWTGKGQTPVWVREMLAKGYTRQQMEASLP